MTDLNVDKLTPPSELVEQWRTAPEFTGDDEIVTMVTMTMRRLREVAAQAAGWGSDQELDACCEWANATGWEGAGDSLRTARRPEPPPLKEQLKKLLNQMPGPGADAAVLRNWADRQSPDLIEVIRSALEALPND